MKKGTTPEPDPKPWYESKTMWVNIAGVVAVFAAGMADWLTEVDENTITASAVGWAALNIILRISTKRPLRGAK